MSANGFPAPNTPGYVYLVHFSGRTKQGRQHYLGFSSDLKRRYEQHRSGCGAHETKKALAEGLKLTIAQTWRGTPRLERRLKDWSSRGGRDSPASVPSAPEQTSCRQSWHETWANRPYAYIASRLRIRSNHQTCARCPDACSWVPTSPAHSRALRAVKPVLLRHVGTAHNSELFYLRTFLGGWDRRAGFGPKRSASASRSDGGRRSGGRRM